MQKKHHTSYEQKCINKKKGGDALQQLMQIMNPFSFCLAKPNLKQSQPAVSSCPSI
jgi:hypothetical protein